MSYKLTIHQITCVLPSSSVSTDIDEAAHKAQHVINDAGLLAVGAVAVFQTEMAPLAMAGDGVLVAITDITASAAGPVLEKMDVFLRDEGFLPDDFYITKESDPQNPVEGGDHEDDVLYPDAGKDPRTHNKNLSKDESISPNLSVVLEQGEGLVFWDHDNVGGDDPLLVLPALDKFLGTNDGTYTNMAQDCAYAVNWTLESI